MCSLFVSFGFFLSFLFSLLVAVAASKEIRSVSQQSIDRSNQLREVGREREREQQQKNEREETLSDQC